MLADPHLVFVSHRRELLAWLTHRVRDAHMAQDLVQELFVRFQEVAARHPVHDARAYLFQMARHLLADQARQNDARKTTAVDPEDLVEVQDGAPGPDRTLAGRQRLAQLAQALQELPELTQRIFVMVRVEDLSYQEAAERLDLSTSSVQKHLARALAHVAQRVPDEMPSRTPPTSVRAPTLRRPVALGGGLTLAALVAIVVVTGGDPMLAWQADARTAVGESRELTLPDGSHVRLFADSAIAVHYTAGERRIELLQGEALFEARPVAEGAVPERRPFVVTAAGGSTRALGTRFVVERLATHTRVVGVEHRVAVSVASRPAAATTLSEGQAVRYDVHGVGAVETVPPQWLEAETQGQLVFERTRLDDVVARLNRHYPGRIVVRGDALVAREVSGVFPSSDVDGAVATLQAELHLRVLRVPGLVILY